MSENSKLAYDASLVAVDNNNEINAIIDNTPESLAPGTELTIVKLESPGWVKAQVCSGPNEGEVVILRYHEDNYRLLARA